ncbi:MAG: LysM peptidoglycan-binding domain-containing protein [Anaerolineales bacterium]
MRKIAILFVITGILLSSCSPNLWGTYDTTPTVPSTAAVTVFTDPQPSPTDLVLPFSTVQSTAIPPSPTVTTTPTIPAVTPGTPRASFIYSSQSGDSLEAVALHFGVSVSKISSTVNLPKAGLLNPGTPLIIPNRVSQIHTTPSTKIIPDCELVYSPCDQGFNIEQFVNTAGGYLSTFHEPLGNVVITGSEGIKRIAFGSSIGPRMLLALIQYYSGWVQGAPNQGVDKSYPLGYQNPLYIGLYQQLRLVVQDLLAGYYGWRDGTLIGLTFPDGSTLRLDPTLNAGTVALQYLFSKRLSYNEWLQAIDPNAGFPSLFAGMFGDPWVQAQETGPLFPPDMTQPNFTLPFEVGAPWTLTGGPHPAWEQESALAALDFAPAMDAPGCGVSNAWVVAVAPGLIVRSEDGYVVLDLDQDGFEQTGWVFLYEHIAAKDRIPVNTVVNAGDHIGHPSCEGGTATGTHVHVARKYNGEWVAAGDPLPFILSGWTAHAGSAPYQGTLTKGNLVVTASQVSLGSSKIIRQPGQ